jgi:hypothetical protein
MIGIGIRLAQDVGAHRRKVYQSKPSLHDELWKRAFWYFAFHDLIVHEAHFILRLLVIFDRQVSCGLGRPCAIQDEESVLPINTPCGY